MVATYLPRGVEHASVHLLEWQYILLIYPPHADESVLVQVMVTDGPTYEGPALAKIPHFSLPDSPFLGFAKSGVFLKFFP